VDDPAAAAVATLIALATRSEGLTPAGENGIKNEMRSVMGMTRVEETFVFARWVAGHATDPNTLSFRFAKLWQTSLNLSEREDFLAMAERAARLDGAAGPEQISALRLLRDRLGLTRP
jgi:hypothetical protein